MKNTTAELAKELWDNFNLETVIRKKESGKTYVWEKEQENRKRIDEKKNLEIYFVMTSKWGNIEATAFPLDRKIKVGREVMSEVDFFQEVFASISDIEKTKHISLLEKSNDAEEIKQIIKPLYTALLNPQKNKIKINWDLYEKTREFWHLADIQSIRTEVIEAEKEEWKRKKQRLNNNKKRLKKETEINFLWAGEEMNAILIYKEFETEKGKALYPHRIVLEEGEFEVNELIYYLLNKLPKGQAEKFEFQKNKKTLLLEETISMMLPLSNIVESL